MPSPLSPAELDRLARYAQTDWQRKVANTVKESGSCRKAAIQLGRDHSAILAAINRMRVAAEKQGDSPEHGWTHTVPDSHLVKGVSSLYGEDGSLKVQWVKSQIKDEAKFEQMEEFAKALADSVHGKAKPRKAPKVDTKELLTVYPIGDPHIGMYAWHEEAGEDFDLRIAESDLQSASERLVSVSPASDEALILNLGDFFHADNQAGVTSRSGHKLDTDSRHGKVMRVGKDAMIALIDLALQRHNQVTVKNVIGNHDDITSYALALILDAYYNREPRVTVDISPNPFWYYRFGKVLIGTTHGHNVKPEILQGIMAHDKPQDWGETLHRYWYLGHFHTKRVHEVGSVLIEYFRTLAGKDAWTNEMGYRSGRDMNSIIHHREYGEIERHRADILMVRA